MRFAPPLFRFALLSKRWRLPKRPRLAALVAVAAAVSTAFAAGSTAEAQRGGLLRSGLARRGLVQTPASGKMGLNEMQALGLQQSWLESLSLPSGPDTLASIEIYVDTDNPHQFVELVVTDPAAGKPTDADSSEATPTTPEPTKVLMRLRIGDMGPEGRTLDPTEADRIADNEIRRLKRRGYNPVKRTIDSPNVLIYSLATDGTLQSRDGETGRLNWQVGIGDPVLGYGRLGISRDHVLVTNNANLYQLSAADGRIVSQMRLNRVPSFGAISVGDYGILHATGGSIDIFDLRDLQLDPYYERVEGSATTRPTSAPGSLKVAWPTDRGFVYVTELGGQPSTPFRVKVDGVVRAGLTAGMNEDFYFGTDRGQCYGLRTNVNGEILWTESLGLAVVSTPMLLDDRLFVLTEFGELFCLDAKTGDRMWTDNPRNVGRLYAAFDGRLFAEDLAGRFRVFDVRDGSLMATPVQFEPQRVVTNVQTNRLYLVDARGLLQCLRPIDSDLPRMIARTTPPAAAAATDAAESETVAETTPPDKSPTDPFAAPTDDPFGAGDDPFGAAGDDPFGDMGDDPFGGDPFN